MRAALRGSGRLCVSATTTRRSAPSARTSKDFRVRTSVFRRLDRGCTGGLVRPPGVERKLQLAGRLRAATRRPTYPYPPAMPSSPTLTSTVHEQTGLDAETLARPEPTTPAEALDPLPPLLPPEGGAASRLRDVAERVKGLRGTLDLAGIRGSAGAAVAAAIARQGRRVVLVAADLDGARRAAEDVGFLARGALDDDAEDTGEGEVLVFAGQDSSPYADGNADRRAAMSRMATLFHLAHDRPWSVLCVPASALARKVVPRKELAKRADRIVAEQE